MVTKLMEVQIRQELQTSQILKPLWDFAARHPLAHICVNGSDGFPAAWHLPAYPADTEKRIIEFHTPRLAGSPNDSQRPPHPVYQNLKHQISERGSARVTMGITGANAYLSAMAGGALNQNPDNGKTGEGFVGQRVGLKLIAKPLPQDEIAAHLKRLLHSLETVSGERYDPDIIPDQALAGAAYGIAAYTGEVVEVTYAKLDLVPNFTEAERGALITYLDEVSPAFPLAAALSGVLEHNLEQGEPNL